MKTMKKVLSIFISAVMVITSCLCFSLTAFANNYASGADIQKALDQNKRDSSSPITVTVSGTYYLSERLVIYSNTTLDCTGATFIKNYDNSTMLAIGQNQDAPTGNSYYKNITLKGGVFDGNMKNGSIFSFAHASNVNISGVTFKDCTNGHHLTFAGCSGVTVTGCSFSGHYSASGDNMEAVQLDILEKDHFPNYKDYPAAYDGTMNENITITGNSFANVNRGVGCHSVFAGKYMKNINISSNTFTNVAGYAVLASGFLNTTVNYNTITNCGSGIYYKSINPDGSNTYADSGKTYAPTVDTHSEIIGNTITVTDNNDATSKQGPYAIRLYGENLSADKAVSSCTIKAGDYRAQNVTISSNNITVARSAMGIWLVGACNNTVSSNSISYTSGYSSSQKAFGIRLEKSDKNSIASNTVAANNVAYVESAIMLDNSKSNTLTQNTVSKAKKHGISVSNNSTATLNKNTSSSNGENGIYCYSKSAVTTNSNTLKSNKKYGIYINDCKKSKIKLSKDKVQSNKKNGISLQKATKVTISSANVTKNNGYGIYLTQSSSASISKCTVSSGKKDGIYSTQKSTANISGGTVSSNKGNGIYFTNSAKGSVKSTSVKKNKKYGIYLTKKVGKIKISKVKYSSNKSGKIKK